MKKIFFVSKNVNKYNEIRTIAGSDEIKIEWYKKEIPELQTSNCEELIKDKAYKAFNEIKRPVLVEHTLLKIMAFNELPGVQTNYFYQNMGCKEIVEYCKYKNEYRASAESILCFCDGKKYYIEHGIEEGSISKNIIDDKGFEWDKIFIPHNNNEKKITYAQLDKHKYSMRQKAWSNLDKICQKEGVWEQIENDTEDDIIKLAELIKQRKVLLFVGAGLSASVGFPSWKELIHDLGKKENYVPALFESYGDYMLLAEYVGLKDDNVPYEYIKKKFEITNEIKEKLVKSEIYEKILQLDFPIIYTTNYDRLIEEYFTEKKHKYKSVVKIDDMKETNSVPVRIMKFHGDIEDKDSIVLSESQYFARMDFQSFMDVQLQADMLQYHVLFLGYSLSDVNIKLLLYLARKRRLNGKEPMEAYIFTATPNKIQKEVFEKNGIITFSGEDVDKRNGTLEFLRRLCDLQ